MKCNFEALCMYLTDVLDEAHRAVISTHLQECEICRDAVKMITEDRDAGGQGVRKTHRLKNIADNHRVHSVHGHRSSFKNAG